MTGTNTERGHLLRAHTADGILEAWGPTREACLEEAVLALIDSIVEVDLLTWWWHEEVELSGTDEEMLVTLLEEVIYRLDTDSAVPVLVAVHPHGDHTLAHLWMTDLHRVTPVGPAPKGISYSGVEIHEQDTGRWHCTATVDV
jgi:SHS2 domain-containing protein